MAIIVQVKANNMPGDALWSDIVECADFIQARKLVDELKKGKSKLTVRIVQTREFE